MSGIHLRTHFNAIPSCEKFTDYSHRVFVGTEGAEEPKQTLEILSQAPVLDSKKINAVVGVGGVTLLNIAAIRGEKSTDSSSSIGSVIVLDRSARVEAFWTDMTEIIQNSDDRNTVHAKINALLIAKKVEFFSGYSEDPEEDARQIEVLFKTAFFGLQREIKEGVSFLSSDERFDKVKKIFERNFFFIRIDLFGDQGPALRESLLAANVNVDTVYISNVSEYCDPSVGYRYANTENREKLLQFIACLIDQSIVNQKVQLCFTAPRECEGCIPLKLKTIEIVTADMDQLSQMHTQSLVRWCDICRTEVYVDDYFDQMAPWVEYYLEDMSPERVTDLFARVKEEKKTCLLENINLPLDEPMQTIQSHIPHSLLRSIEPIVSVIQNVVAQAEEEQQAGTV